MIDSVYRPQFDGRTALVTGGTNGVGLRIAERLVAFGARVVVNGRNEQRGEQAVDRLRAAGGEAVFASGDVRDPDEMRQVVDVAVALQGHLDVLVSAGAPTEVTPKPFAEMTAAEVRRTVESDFLSRIFPLHAAVGALHASGGCAVMLTTDAARHATVGESVIGAVGAGVILLTKVVAKELARDHVRVNTVALTLTSGTPAWDRIFAEEGFQKDMFTKALGRFPFGRAPTAEEVASVAVFLASDDAAQVTGQTVSVNGGLSFAGW